MQVKKRDGSMQNFDTNKIKNAIAKANAEMDEYHQIWEGDIPAMVEEIIEEITPPLWNPDSEYEVLVDIEEIQDAVELCLQREGYYELAKAYKFL